MFTIHHHLKELAKALAKGQSIVCNAKGFWYVENFFMRLACFVLDKEDRRMRLLLKAFNRALDDVERRKGTKDYQSYLHTGELLKSKAQNSQNVRVIVEVRKLSRRLIGLRYRIGASGGGADPLGRIDPYQFSKLKNLARKWKAGQIFFGETAFSLTAEERLALKSACRYREFAALVLEDAVLSHDFFRWVISNQNPVDVFIQFPKTVKRLSKCLLASRLSIFGKRVLIRMSGHEHGKDLELLFEDQYQSVLDEQTEIYFKTGYSAAIYEIFKAFQNKRSSMGNFEVSSQGIINFNNGELARLDEKGKLSPISFESSNWWEQLPASELTCSEAEKRYGVPLDGISWVICKMATRRFKEYLPYGSHARLEIAIPDGGGCYRMVSFSLGTLEVPLTTWNQLKGIAMTYSGRVVFDDTFYYTHREHHPESALVFPETGRMLMDKIKTDIQKGWNQELVYQFFTYNCAYWVQRMFEKVVGSSAFNSYEMSFDEIHPPRIVATFHKTVSKFSPFWKGVFYHLLFFPLGSWKAMEIKRRDGSKKKISLWLVAPWNKNGWFLNPARAFHRKSVAVKKARASSFQSVVDKDLV